MAEKVKNSLFLYICHENKWITSDRHMVVMMKTNLKHRVTQDWGDFMIASPS